MTWSVLLLDPLERQTLAACRALGRAGHTIGIGGPETGDPAQRSRYVSRFHLLPNPCGPQAPFRGALEAVVAAHRYDVVVSGDDATIARLRTLDPLPFPCVPALDDGFGRLTDKVTLARLAAEANVAYPVTFRPERPEQIEALVKGGELQLPLAVKSDRSATSTASSVRHHQGATVARDLRSAIGAAQRLRDEGAVPIVQEFIHRREKVNLSIVRRDHRSEMRFTYRVLRDVPLTGGIAMATETIRPDTGTGADAIACLERVCDAAGYEGVANGEFCLAHDGRLYLIEVNPRLWGSTWFAERLGQRVTERIVRLALGLPALPPVPYAAGRRFHHVRGELRWLRLRGGGLGPLLELAQTTRPGDVFDRIDLSDPAPLAHYALSAARHRIRGGLGRVNGLPRQHQVPGAGGAHDGGLSA